MTFPCQRTSVEAAGSHFRLIEPAVFKADFLRACLAGRLLTVCMTVIEDIILSFNFNEAAVRVAGAHSGMLRIRHAGQTDVAAADKNAAVLKAMVRIITDRVTEVVAVE